MFIFIILLILFTSIREFLLGMGPTPLYKILKFYGIGYFFLILILDISKSINYKINTELSSEYALSISTIIIGLLLQIIINQKNIQSSIYFKIGDIIFWKEKSMKYKVNNIENGYIEFYSIDNYDIEKLSLKDALSKLGNETFVKQN